MKINSMVQDRYLTCGQTYDNFMFMNCPTQFLRKAEETLSNPSNDVVPVVIRIDEVLESGLNNIFSKCSDSFQKKVMARTLFLSMLMKGVLAGFNIDYKHYTQAFLDDGISMILKGDFEQAKKFYLRAPLEQEINSVIRENGKIELDLILDNSNNSYLQMAINNHFASREPYSIKLFSNKKDLVTYYSESGQIIQDVHDYMDRDLSSYIELEESDYCDGL